MVTEMADFLKGGAKGEPGKTSSGIRGGEDIIIKATRPFGGLHSLVQPPCHSEIFKKPRFFHLGMNEETAGAQQDYNYLVVRKNDVWWGDFYFLIAEVEKGGHVHGYGLIMYGSIRSYFIKVCPKQ